MNYSEEYDGNKRFIRYKEGADWYSLSQSTFERRAKEAGAVMKIGKVALVDRKIFERYLELFRMPSQM